jgi:hypothetical protein
MPPSWVGALHEWEAEGKTNRASTEANKARKARKHNISISTTTASTPGSTGGSTAGAKRHFQNLRHQHRGSLEMGNGDLAEGLAAWQATTQVGVPSMPQAAPQEAEQPAREMPRAHQHQQYQQYQQPPVPHACAVDQAAFKVHSINGPAWFQNFWEPCVSCGNERRIGQRGDGGKWVCVDKSLAGTGIISVGSNNEFSFEQVTLFSCGGVIFLLPTLVPDYGRAPAQIILKNN